MASIYLTQTRITYLSPAMAELKLSKPSIIKILLPFHKNVEVSAPEDRGSRFPPQKKVGKIIPDFTVSHKKVVIRIVDVTKSKFHSGRN